MNVDKVFNVIGLAFAGAIVYNIFRSPFSAGVIRAGGRSFIGLVRATEGR